MKALIPILVILIATVGGGAAGLLLKPAPAAEDTVETPDKENLPEKAAVDPSFVKMSNQFVIPILGEDKVKALVVMSLSLEVDDAETDDIYQLEPKLRDASLRVFFDHAYAGGFDGPFTASPKLDQLRALLLEAVNEVADGRIHAVLITDIVRQDT